MQDYLKPLWAGATAGCVAVCITNPMDLAKTRLQLQGELMRKGEYQKQFSGVISCLRKTASFEGLAAVQKGIVPALYFQLIMNGFRLGMYERLKQHTAKYITTRDLTNAVTGGLTGWIGGFLGSPFNLIKTRLMLQSPFLPSGDRYSYNGFTDATKTIYKVGGYLMSDIDRMGGLFKGSMLWACRTGMGSAIQLPALDRCRELILPIVSGVTGMMCCSAISTFCLCVVMSPIDGLTTRYFVQPYDAQGRGQLYSNPLEGAHKILGVEGVTGLYKGFGAFFARVGPHSFISLVLFSYLMQ